MLLKMVMMMMSMMMRELLFHGNVVNINNNRKLHATRTERLQRERVQCVHTTTPPLLSTQWPQLPSRQISWHPIIISTQWWGDQIPTGSSCGLFGLHGVSLLFWVQVDQGLLSVCRHFDLGVGVFICISCIVTLLVGKCDAICSLITMTMLIHERIEIFNVFYCM